MERDFFGIFEETIGSPNIVQPIDVEYAIFFEHIWWQSKSWISPTLRQKYIHTCRHRFFIHRIQRQNWVWKETGTILCRSLQFEFQSLSLVNAIMRVGGLPVTWKYTTVGCSSNFGARFLSYVRDSGIISDNDSVDCTSPSWLLFLVEIWLTLDWLKQTLSHNWIGKTNYL